LACSVVGAGKSQGFMPTRRAALPALSARHIARHGGLRE
jgi:hypothetical protein